MATVRRALASDLDRLIQLHRRFTMADGHEFSAERAAAALLPLLHADHHGVVWLAEADTGEGYAVVTWGWSLESGGRDALVDEIYAHPPGAGIGSALMRALLDDIEERGIETVFLETEANNEPARRLYRRFAFVPEDSVWMVRRT